MNRKGKPNLLHIFADELRAMALSCAGNPNLQTPNMDRLAGEGARFTRMYTPSPLCTPARSSMMTGLLPHNTGAVDNMIRMRTDNHCIAELTLARGYRTAHIGKWHLEGTDGGEAAYDFVPKERHRGFEYWAGFEHGHRYWKGKYYLKEEKPIQYGGYEPDVQTDQAIEFIKKNKDGPWHMDLSWGPPHFPLAQTKPEDIARFEPADIILRANVPEKYAIEARQDHAAYYAMTANLDWNLGRILSVIDELGLADNTIVIFTSDHGDMLFSHGQHYKRRPQEESVLVPFLIRFPGEIAPGLVVDTVASLVDEVPTVLDLMGIETPVLDGISHSAFLCGSEYGSGPESVYMQCPRLGCREYDPGPFSQNPWRAVCTERYKATYLKMNDGKSVRMIQLYDLAADPLEMSNLAGGDLGGGVGGDSAAGAVDRIVAEMNRQLACWLEKSQDEEFMGLELLQPSAEIDG